MNIASESLQRVRVPACVIDEYGRVVGWNQWAADFFGLCPDTALGSEWHALVQTLETPGCCALCQTRQALRQGDPLFPIEATLAVAGQTRPVIMVPVPMTLNPGLAIGFLILSHEPVGGCGSAQRSARPPRVGVSRTTSNRTIDDLTAREREILACVVDGFDARSIADELGISHATARNYVQRVLSKLGAHNKA